MMSLRLQLVGTILLVLLGTLFLGAFLTYRHALNKIDTEMKASIAVGTRIAKNAVDDADEVLNPHRRLRLLVADFDGDRHLQASLVNTKGIVVAVSTIESPEEGAPEWLFKLLNPPPIVSVVQLPSVFSNYGTIHFSTAAQNEIAEVWQDVKLFMIILGIFCLSGLTGLLLILDQAMKPLAWLTTAFQRIGAGDNEPRMPETGSHEFVALAKGFNQMASQLAEMGERNRSLLIQIETVQEEERAELARNLHDEVSPMLFCMGVDAKAIERNAIRDNNLETEGHAKAILSAVTGMKGNIKTILGELRSAKSHALGLHGAIEDLVEFWKLRHPAVTFIVQIPAEAFGPKIEDALQSIIGESVNNALKHARPDEIKISLLQTPSAIEMTITDNGGGLRTLSQERGFGIPGMHERAIKLGGNLDVEGTNTGVVVTVKIPFIATGSSILSPSDNLHGKALAL